MSGDLYSEDERDQLHDKCRYIAPGTAKRITEMVSVFKKREYFVYWT